MLPGDKSYKSKPSCLKWFWHGYKAVRTEDAPYNSQPQKADSSSTLLAEDLPKAHRKKIFTFRLRNTLIHNHNEDSETESSKVEAKEFGRKTGIFNKMIFSGKLQRSKTPSTQKGNKFALKNDLVYAESNCCASSKQNRNGSSGILKNRLVFE
ncbi:hypothetical protein HDU81_004746 [Chytriomyces hyalinus]|nr:hypothetical protein HDU81_004746 [Chytriomyces hyalinus]